MFKSGRKQRSEKLTTRQVQRIVHSYPINVDGVLRSVKPHDLRRTYARRMFETGMKPEAIQQNLGHGDLKTTMLYIGTLDSATRSPSGAFSFDLSVFS